MKTLPLFREALEEAAHVLRNGGTVVYPTETAYALGADPFQLAAVEAVFAIKGRNGSKPLGLIASSVEQVEELCNVAPDERALFHFWPGALSLVLKIYTNLSVEWLRGLKLATAGSDRVSLRVSGNGWARDLAATLCHPIIATSANRSGAGECYSVEEVQKQLADGVQPDLLLDGGTLDRVRPSTVVLVEHGTIKVLRKGAVKI